MCCCVKCVDDECEWEWEWEWEWVIDCYCGVVVDVVV